jgi:S1-C subfamily serine protease
VAAGLALLAAALAWADSPAPRPAATRVVSVLVAGTTERVTGFAAGSGRVITAGHVFGSGEQVVLRTGGRVGRRARLLRLDRRADLALLAAPGLRGGSLATASAMAGDAVTVLVRRHGRTVRVPARVRRAIVAHVAAGGGTGAGRRPALELEARVRAGDSGGPVLTENGELAGVLFARSRERAATAYAVDSVAVSRMLRTAR